MDINDIYVTLFQIGRLVQQENYNGLEVWRHIEKTIPSHIMGQINSLELRYDLNERIFNEAIRQMTVGNFAIKEKTCIFYHFFSQLINIPVKKDPIIKLNRILQIAYNAGQLSYLMENDDELKKLGIRCAHPQTSKQLIMPIINKTPPLYPRTDAKCIINIDNREQRDDIMFIIRFVCSNNLLLLNSYINESKQHIINMILHRENYVINIENPTPKQHGGTKYNYYNYKYNKYMHKIKSLIQCE